ncbi:MAG: 3'(2'),5'-bisphosphate nucleotidase CysQ [Bauldia sp.]
MTAPVPLPPIPPDPALQADTALAEALVPAMLAAGEAILAARAAGNAVELKADASPVTAADRASEAILLAALRRLAPDIPVIAEEEAAAGRIPRVGHAFFLVDPLDGTKDYIRGGPDFTVNIGLVRDGRAVMGLVLAPADSRLWLGTVGGGALAVETASGRRRPIRVRKPPERLGIVASRSHRTPETDAFIARFEGAEVVAAGSSQKLCALADGRADLYPRLGDTWQWDTAAGDAVLAAAGGRVLALDGAPLAYGPRNGVGEGKAWLNPWFVATAGIDPFAK